MTHHPHPVCKDPQMLKILTLSDKVALSDASVLITGESGTGKEVIARYIHQKSLRQAKPFVCLNCAAVPENLLESELFGHEKGAFTGSIARRIGKFEEAHGGTILLDEISEMHPRLQAKLLRAIQEREIDRVGGNQPVKVNIRIIATSNRDLQEMVRTGQFREDLYFRLNVIHIHLPPLRQRLLDIEGLTQFFCKKHQLDKKISTSALQALKGYRWPGNVRELENTVYRSLLLAHENEVQASDILYDHTCIQSTPELVGRTVAEVERELIMNTLNHCSGNRTHAATILGISIRTLRNKLKAYAV